MKLFTGKCPKLSSFSVYWDSEHRLFSVWKKWPDPEVTPAEQFACDLWNTFRNDVLGFSLLFLFTYPQLYSRGNRFSFSVKVILLGVSIVIRIWNKKASGTKWRNCGLAMEKDLRRSSSTGGFYLFILKRGVGIDWQLSFIGVTTGFGFVNYDSPQLWEWGMIPEMGFSHGWACKWVYRRICNIFVLWRYAVKKTYFSWWKM